MPELSAGGGVLALHVQLSQELSDIDIERHVGLDHGRKHLELIGCNVS